MTNIIAEITVTLALVTNWTGVSVGTNELGYVATNHAARIIYEGETNVFQLKSVPSRIAVWRPKDTGWWIATNWPWSKVPVFTNSIHHPWRID